MSAMPAASVPEVLALWLRPFAPCFTAAVWRHALVLVAGTVLTPGRRTVAAALRVMGLDQAAGFAVYHRVLSMGRWSSRAVARRLLLLLVAALVPRGPVVVGVDDTIERRWGAKIRARGIYRDPVRSSHGHFVKASGLRWLCVALLAPVPWAGCVWALPFLTVLAPSERYAAARGRRHKKLTDWARQALLQVARWLPGRHVVAVTDSSFSAIELLRDVGRHLCLVSRLRLDAALYAPAPPRRPGTVGRPPVKGKKLPSLKQRLADPATQWRKVTLDGWYGGGQRRLDILSDTALWHHPGMRVPIRWILVRDPSGEEAAAGVRLHRPACRAPGRPALVRPPLARRDHVRGSETPPRRGDAAPVDRPRHPAHHARTARAVLARDALGNPTPSRPAPPAAPSASPGIPSTRRPSATPSPSCAWNCGPPRAPSRAPCRVPRHHRPPHNTPKLPADVLNRLLAVACRLP